LRLPPTHAINQMAFLLSVAVAACWSLPAFGNSLHTARSFLETAAKTTAGNSQTAGSFLTVAAHQEQRQATSSAGLENRFDRLNGLYEPLPNDTIGAAYWNEVDAAIQAAAATSQAPVMNSGQFSTTKADWTDVFTKTKNDFNYDDLTDEEKAAGKDVSTVYRPPSASQQAALVGSNVNLVPYHMQLGAKMVYALSETSTNAPIPDQLTVSQQFVTECPMTFISSSIDITAPNCRAKFGQWADPTNGKTVLRWKPDSSGQYWGLYFGVDSRMHGNGSVTFANADQQFSLSGTSFELRNCKGVLRYTIEEQVTSVSHLGAGVTSSIQAHDKDNTGQAFFYQYSVRAANGSIVAVTSQYRSTQNSFTVNMIGSEVSAGAQIASATKKGTWTSQEFGSCLNKAGDPANNAWSVSFDLTSDDVIGPTTVQDLRIATGMLVTLMTYRASETAGGGVSRTGEHKMIAGMVVSLVIVVLVVALLVFCIGALRSNKSKQVKALTACCFKVESSCLPQIPTWKRNSPYNATY